MTTVVMFYAVDLFPTVGLRPLDFVSGDPTSSDTAALMQVDEHDWRVVTLIPKIIPTNGTLDILCERLERIVILAFGLGGDSASTVIIEKNVALILLNKPRRPINAPITDSKCRSKAHDISAAPVTPCRPARPCYLFRFRTVSSMPPLI